MLLWLVCFLWTKPPNVEEKRTGNYLQVHFAWMSTSRHYHSTAQVLLNWESIILEPANSPDSLVKKKLEEKHYFKSRAQKVVIGSMLLICDISNICFARALYTWRVRVCSPLSNLFWLIAINAAEAVDPQTGMFNYCKTNCITMKETWPEKGIKCRKENFSLRSVKPMLHNGCLFCQWSMLLVL